MKFIIKSSIKRTVIKLLYYLTIILLVSITLINGRGDSRLKTDIRDSEFIASGNNSDIEKEKADISINWQTTTISLKPEFLMDASESRTGKPSLKIKGPGAGCWYTTIAVKPGKQYKLSFYFKSRTPIENNPNANIFALVKKKGGTGGQGVFGVNDYHMKTHREWTKIILGTYIPHEGVTALTVSLYLNGNRGKVSNTDNSEVWFDDINIIESDLPSVKQPARLIAAATDYAIWMTSPLANVYKNDSIPDGNNITKKVIIRAARGEKEAFQLVIKPQVGWDGISWEWADFSGPTTILKNRMKSYRVEYINLPEQDKELKPYLRGGYVPDPLPPEPISKLSGGENNAFYFIVDIPGNIKNGTYSNLLKLKKAGQVIENIPIELNVWNFAIPGDPSFDLLANVYDRFIPFYEKGDADAIMKRYLSNIHEHRSITASFTMLKTTWVTDKYGGKFIDLDMNNFQKSISFKKELGECKHLYVHWENLGIWNGKTLGHPDMGVQVFQNNDNSQFTPAFLLYFQNYVYQLINILKNQGCFINPRFTIADEPNIREKSQINFYTNFAKILKDIDPRIKPTAAGDYVLDFLPYFDQWFFPAPTAQFYQKEMALAKRKNSKQIYPNNMVSPAFSPLRMRLYFWGLWKEGYTGLLWWQINGWGWFENALEPSGNRVRKFIKYDPWKEDITKKVVAMIYPPREGKNEVGPINSLRWEAMRKGLEDYEYLHLLEKLIKEKEGKTDQNIIVKAKKALKRVDELIDHLPNIPGDGALNDHFHTYDISLVEEIRTEIAEAIESFTE